MLHNEIVKVKVTGEYACFTRPDLKVERMTYPCMTPSAARGVLDSILWKPEFQWYVRRIIVLKNSENEMPIRFFSIKRNEIKAKQSKNPIYVEEKRAQRNSIILRDVAYIIEASVFQKIPTKENPPKKYIEMFRRRVKKGQCYRRPFLGTREFVADFMEPDGSEIAINGIIPIGSMLFDIFFDDNGKPTPLFFYDVSINNGILNCEIPENDKMMESSHILPPTGSELSAVLYDFKKIEDDEYLKESI